MDDVRRMLCERLVQSFGRPGNHVTDMARETSGRVRPPVMRVQHGCRHRLHQIGRGVGVQERDLDALADEGASELRDSGLRPPIRRAMCVDEQNAQAALSTFRH
jgi:hypothetical protein